MLSRFVMVSTKTSTTYHFVYELANFSSTRKKISLDFCVGPYSSKGSKIISSIFLDWFSHQLNRVLDSYWRDGGNHLRKSSSQIKCLEKFSLSGRQKDGDSTKQLLSVALELAEKPFSIITDLEFLQATRH